MIQTLILTVQHEDYSIFRSWCLGNRCDDHAVKGYVKSIAEDGTITWFTKEEQTNLDISSLESWQIIRYTSEELDELNIIPEDCTYESEQTEHVDMACLHHNHNELPSFKPRI